MKPVSLPDFGTLGKVVVGSGAAIYVNIGGDSQWSDGDIDALRINATFTGTLSIGIDTSDATSPVGYISTLAAGFDLTKLGANTFALTDAATAATVKTLTTSGGVTEIGAALGVLGRRRR